MSEELPVSENLATVYNWPDRWWVRAMMVQTIDGAFYGPDGKSRSISSERDREVLMETRRLADVVLVGAQTIRSERYRPMVAKPEWQQARISAGLLPAPVVAIVSSSLDLPWEEPLFGESAQTPLVITDGGASRDAKEVAERVQADGRVEIIELNALPVGVIDVLRERGFTRIVCEGGPRLLRDLFPYIDEIDLTIAPMLLGRDVGEPDLAEEPNQVNWNLDHVWEHEGFVFSKYLRV
jgi:riboflavin biosynthesis pyrimidine reductase